MENGSSPSSHNQNPTLFTHLKATPSKVKHMVVDFAVRVKKTGEDDPRRVVHSLKVALAITLVSMVYYLQPFYEGLGSAGMWAILTVVVVFEYTVGATLSKGLNRGFATLLAGALGLGAESLAGLFGPTVEPIVLGCLIFLLVAVATFSRFIPSIKMRYDYGVLIFILTYTMVAISGYRVDEIIEMAHQRFSTVILGGATCVIISICVCPVWAGEDLHKHIVLNLEKLACFLEGFGEEYYERSWSDKSFLRDYKSVLNSKATEEALANFAWWEVGHGNFRFRHPWKQYLKIGVSMRQCAYHFEALNKYLEAKLQISEFQEKVQEPCMKMSSEAGKALKELGLSMKLMLYPSTSVIHLQNCRRTIDELNTTLQASLVGKFAILEAVPIIAVTSTLVDIIKSVETISNDIEELSKQAHFKKSNITYGNSRFLHRCGAIKCVDSEEDTRFLAIDSSDIAIDSLKNEKR